MLNSLTRIEIKNPVEIIIRQIQALIKSGEIKSGEKLPPERKLAEHLGVSRNQVREALKKLEFYGILKTNPQSGTIVNGIGIVALEGLITDVLAIQENDFKSLVETRVILEKQAAYLAAQRRTEDDINLMKKALIAYEAKLLEGSNAVAEDLMFHIKIAEASKNTVLKSLMMVITPDILNSYIQLKVCDESENQKTMKEHQEILDYILNQQADKASDAMENHLKDVIDFSFKRKE